MYWTISYIPSPVLADTSIKWCSLCFSLKMKASSFVTCLYDFVLTSSSTSFLLPTSINNASFKFAWTSAIHIFSRSLKLWALKNIITVKYYLLIDFINKKYDLRAPIKYSSDWIITFLSAWVPEHHLEKLLSVNMRCYSCEFCSDRHFMVIRKGIISYALNDTAFANSRVSN